MAEFGDRHQVGLLIFGCKGRLLAILLASIAALSAVQGTLADSPIGVSITANQVGSQITVSGTWAWDCSNSDKMVGWAVSWDDPADDTSANAMGLLELGENDGWTDAYDPANPEATPGLGQGNHVFSSLDQHISGPPSCRDSSAPSGPWGPLTHTYSVPGDYDICAVIYDIHITNDVPPVADTLTGAHSPIAGGASRNTDNSIENPFSGSGECPGLSFTVSVGTLVVVNINPANPDDQFTIQVDDVSPAGWTPVSHGESLSTSIIEGVHKVEEASIPAQYTAPEYGLGGGPSSDPTCPLEPASFGFDPAATVVPANGTVVVCVYNQIIADLSVAIVDDVDPVFAGFSLMYTVTVTNNGPGDANNVVVTDWMPAGVTLISTSGCAEDADGVPTCSLGFISSGAIKMFTISVSIDSSTVGIITNPVAVTFEGFDPDTTNNSADEDTMVVQPGFATVTAIKRFDNNENGHIDPEDTFVSDWRMTLRCNTENAQDDIIQFGVTDGSGSVLFVIPGPGPAPDHECAVTEAKAPHVHSLGVSLNGGPLLTGLSPSITLGGGSTAAFEFLNDPSELIPPPTRPSGNPPIEPPANPADTPEPTSSETPVPETTPVSNPPGTPNDTPSPGTDTTSKTPVNGPTPPPGSSSHPERRAVEAPPPAAPGARSGLASTSDSINTIEMLALFLAALMVLGGGLGTFAGQPAKGPVPVVRHIGTMKPQGSPSSREAELRRPARGPHDV